jgi:hypothetical protein
MTAATTSQTMATMANRKTASQVNLKTIQVTMVRTTPAARLAMVEMMALMFIRMDRILLPLTQAVGLWLAAKPSNQAKK